MVRTIGLAFTVATLLLISPTRAWTGYVHWRVAKEVAESFPAGSVDPDYAMGPDTFRSRDIINISTEFTWSHAVHRVSPDPLVPDKPDYSADGRYPGQVMYDLVTKKLSPSSASTLTFQDDAAADPEGLTNQDPLLTSLGFLIHNASDHIVHWEFFLGGDTPPACSAGLGGMWTTHHRDKEEWAAYIVMVLEDGLRQGGVSGPLGFFHAPGNDGVLGTADDINSCLTEDWNQNGVFDGAEYEQNGDGALTDYIGDVFGPPSSSCLGGGRIACSIVNPCPGSDICSGFLEDKRRFLLPYLIAGGPPSYNTNLKLQHLAMKAHRKNRRETGVSTGGVPERIFEVAGYETIRNAFLTEISNLDPGEGATAELRKMSYEKLTELNMLASEAALDSSTPGCVIPPWQPILVSQQYDASVARAIAWLQNASQ